MSLKRLDVAAICLSTLLAAPLAGAGSGFSPELVLKAAAGYDSNVFRLNDSVGAQGGMFVDADVGLSGETAVGKHWKLGAELDLAARLYDSSVSDGDDSRYRLSLGGERKPTAGRGLGFEWALSHGVSDSTYVSRTSGRVAESDGQQIGDRFDSARSELSSRVSKSFTRRVRGMLAVTVENKDYRSDYVSLGVDRLDYVAYGLEPGIVYRDKNHRLDVSFPLTSRRYRDRRASDRLGNQIPGSDLNYRYAGADARYKYDVTPVHALTVSAGFRNRRDNAVGYADSATKEVGLGWIIEARKHSRGSVEINWSSRQYDRIDSGTQQLNEEAVQRKGYSLVVEFSTPVPGFATPDLKLFASGRWDSFKNERNAVFTYDGYQALVGVRKDFN